MKWREACGRGESREWGGKITCQPLSNEYKMGPRAVVGIKCPEEMQVLIPMPTLPFLQLKTMKLNLKCVLTEPLSHLSPTTTLGSY